MSVTRVIRKARKVHKCHVCDKPGKIQPGDSYLTHTALAGDEFGYDSYFTVTAYGLRPANPRPQRSNECTDCATRYGRAELLAAP